MWQALLVRSWEFNPNENTGMGKISSAKRVSLFQRIIFPAKLVTLFYYKLFIDIFFSL